MNETNRPRVGVACLIFNEKNEMLMGKRLDAHGASCWSTPGGHLEYGESIVDCAARETLEETGLRLRFCELDCYTSDVFTDKKVHYITCFAFAFCIDGADARNMEPDKCEGWVWMHTAVMPTPLFLPLASLRDKYSSFVHVTEKCGRHGEGTLFDFYLRPHSQEKC